jgi:hypothetical protein
MLLRQMVMIFFTLGIVGLYADDSAENNSENKKKCIDLASRNCSAGVDLSTCIKNHPNIFPSFCQEEIISPMKAINKFSKSQTMQSCSQALKGKCTLDVRSEKAKKQSVQKLVDDYRECVKKEAAELKACQAMAKSLTDSANGKPVVQQIR